MWLFWGAQREELVFDVIFHSLVNCPYREQSQGSGKREHGIQSVSAFEAAACIQSAKVPLAKISASVQTA